MCCVVLSFSCCVLAFCCSCRVHAGRVGLVVCLPCLGWPCEYRVCAEEHCCKMLTCLTKPLRLSTIYRLLCLLHTLVRCGRSPPGFTFLFDTAFTRFSTGYDKLRPNFQIHKDHKYLLRSIRSAKASWNARGMAFGVSFRTSPVIESTGLRHQKGDLKPN